MDTSEQTILNETPKREARRRRSVEEKRRNRRRDVRRRRVGSTRGASASSQRQPGFFLPAQQGDAALFLKAGAVAADRHYNQKDSPFIDSCGSRLIREIQLSLYPILNSFGIW